MRSNTISMNDILAMLSTLSIDNKKWLAEKLNEEVAAETSSSYECGVDEALDDIKYGRVYKASSTEDMFNKILS